MTSITNRLGLTSNIDDDKIFEEFEKEMTSKSTDTDTLLAERETTHGDYLDTARIAQQLKGVIVSELFRRDERGQPQLSFVQRESLDLICTKIARMVTGNPDEVDHFDDIAGYAKLGNRK